MPPFLTGASSFLNSLGSAFEPVNSILSTIGQVASLRNLFRGGGASAGAGNIDIGPLSIPRELLGTGLLGASAALPADPLQNRGAREQAVQALRNEFTSPADPFAPGGAYALQLPAIARSEKELADALQTRYAAAFPANIRGIQGSENQGLERLYRDFDINRKSLEGNLLQGNLDRQQTAAYRLLSLSKPSALDQLLGLLGAELLRGGTGGALTDRSSPIMGTDGASQTVGPGGITPDQLFGRSGGFSGLSGFQGAAQQIQHAAQAAGGLNNLLMASPQAVNQVAQLLGAQVVSDFDGALTGVPGYAIQTSQGVYIPADAVNLSTVGSAAPGAASTVASGASAVLGAAGAAGAGFGVGDLIGSHLKMNEALSAVAGGAAGAATGAATAAAIGAMLGDGPGAVIGAIVGGLFGAGGGAFGRSKAIRSQKEASIQQEQSATAQARPGVLQQAQQVVAESQALLPQVEPEIHPPYTRLTAVGQRLAANDPQATQWLQAVGQKLGALGDETAIKHDLPNSLEGAAQAMRLIIRAIGILQEYSPQSPTSNADGSETNWGLLQSSEIGKFSPGVTKFHQRLTDFQSAVSLYQQYLQLSGG